MSIIEAIVLAVVQGFSEFLPISSSGHLVLVPFIFGWDEPSLAFIVAAHLGTTLSIVWVFRERLVQLVRSLFGLGNPADRRYVGLIAAATVPAAVIGAVFTNQVERVFERPVISSFLLAGTAWILFSVETAYEKRDETTKRDERMATPLDAATVGVAQAVAILPGISRSGSTIAAGMVRGLTREAAAKFSFLMAIPIILGATLVKVPDMVREGTAGSGPAILIGVVFAGVTGVVSIRAMLGVVARRGFRPFAIYCLFAMTAGILTALARG